LFVIPGCANGSARSEAKHFRVCDPQKKSISVAAICMPSVEVAKADAAALRI
jgi:hypothetical protein